MTRLLAAATTGLCYSRALLLVSETTAAPVSGSWVSIPVTDTTCDVRDHGAKGDGRTDDTVAIQAAISTCISSKGTAVVPAGFTFMSWGLSIKGAYQFALRVDGTLRFFNDTKAWPAADTACILMSTSSFVAVHGSGVIDGGGGAAWWSNPNDFRPGLMHTNGGTDLLIRDVTFIQSPNHNLQLYTSIFEVVNTTILAWPMCSSGPICAHNTGEYGCSSLITHARVSAGDDYCTVLL